jgi:hypothetical protein
MIGFSMDIGIPRKKLRKHAKTMAMMGENKASE